MNDNVCLGENNLNGAKKYQILKKLCASFMEIFTKSLSKENLNTLMELKSEILSLKKNNKTREIGISIDCEDTLDLILQRMNYFLIESTHKQTSGIIREMIRDIYQIEYQIDDYSLIDCVFNRHKDYPQVFSDKIYSDSRYTLSELVSNPVEKELKEISDLFTKYGSAYPFDKEVSYEALKQMSGSGRMKPFEGFFLWFSDYYSLYSASLNELMNDDDLIPMTWKYYLAITAVSTIRCEYLLRELEMQFLLKGGNANWLVEGLACPEMPEKLKKLGRINNILAHQPWKLKIQDLTEIHSQYDCKAWHINELTHAALILTYYHRLAAIVESAKFNFLCSDSEITQNKTDQNRDSKILKFINENANVKKFIINELETINNTMENSFRNDTNSMRKSSEETSKLNNSFDSTFKINNGDFSKHISSYCTVYLDFDSHSEEFYSYIEFNWQDHGAYILRNYFTKGVDAIDNEVEYISNISSNNIGRDAKRLDTAQYRYTICTYVEKIFGFVNEGFDYSKTNKLLHRSHKQFIKNIACFPQKINKTDVGVLKVTFSPEEIYHIILLVSAAKMRLQLTYFSKILYEIIKSID